jgi:hypothetical protein
MRGSSRSIRPTGRLLAAACVVAVSLLPSAASARTEYTGADVCLEPGYVYFVYADPGAGCGTTTTDDWGVSPSYSGSYYADTASADAAEPPPPVPVIPALPTWRNLYDWPNGHGYAGWHSASAGQTGAYGIQSALGGQYGLWLWPSGGSAYSYGNGNYAEWTYTAPGTTRLANATIQLSYRNKLLAHHCIDIGFRDNNGAVVAHNEHCKPVTPPDSQRGVTVSLVDPASSPTSKVLYIRIRVDCGGASTCTKNIPQLDPLSTGSYLRATKVDMTLVDDDAPSVNPSGPFFDLNTTYINGRGSYALTVGAADAGSGVQRTWAEHAGIGTFADAAGRCDPTHLTPDLDNRICAQSFSSTSTVDTSGFAEGTHTFVAHASDVAGNVGGSAPWTIYVDRTPPPAPASIGLWSYDPATGIADFGFSGGDDPRLADGAPGSGVDHFQYRYAVDGGAWSAWTDTDDTGFDVPGAAVGDSVAVEARAVDGVGNVSAAGTATVEITPLVPQPDPDDSLPDGLNPAPTPTDGATLGGSTYHGGGATQSATTAALAPAAGGICESYLGDPSRFGVIEVQVYSNVLCDLPDVYVTARFCLQVKKVRRFWFDTWSNLKCTTLYTNPKHVFDEATLTAECKVGRHTYRGWVRARFDAVPSYWKSELETSYSVNSLTFTCLKPVGG